MQIVRRNQNPIVPLHPHSDSLVRNLVNFVRDIAVLQIAAHTDTLALVRALPNQRQRFIGRQLLFRKLLHQVHITIGALRKTTSVFRFALRTEHKLPGVYYTRNRPPRRPSGKCSTAPRCFSSAALVPAPSLTGFLARPAPVRSARGASQFSPGRKAWVRNKKNLRAPQARLLPL